MKKEILAIVKEMTETDEAFVIELLSMLDESYDVQGLMEDMNEDNVKVLEEEKEEELKAWKLDRQADIRDYESGL